MSRASTAVMILGQEYRVRSEADPESVQRAARFVDETMERIRTRTGTVDSLDVAVLTALNMANQLLAARESTPDVPSERLRDLIEQVEAAAEQAEAS